MTLLRSLLFYVGAVLVTPCYFVLLLLCFPLPPLRRYRAVNSYSWVLMHWLRLTCGVRWEILGREHIPAQPAVALCKHQSAWETLALQHVLPPQCWVLKRELLKVPFLGWGLALLSPIAIDRAQGKAAIQQLLDQGRQRLAQGFWIVIFPEGTRVAVGQRGKYKNGGASFAVEAGCPVLPIAHNAGELWARNSILKKAGTITISVGHPIDTAGRSAADVMREAEDWIEQEVARISNRLLAPAHNARAGAE